MTAETLYKACNELYRISERKYSEMGLADGHEIRIYWNESNWHNLYYCKAGYREATVLTRNSETGETIQNRAILLRSYSTVIAIAFIPKAYMHDCRTCAVVRFGTFSSTSSSHFWKFIRAITERNGYERVCLYNTFHSYDGILMAILNTTGHYPVWQYMIQRRDERPKGHFQANDYEHMINAAITAVTSNYEGRKAYI